MDFSEKLQELRKSKGLTQEELAEILYVSRAAVSKWESGRGYPSIDSLKEISKFFSVSIDDLLSGEKLISIAEKENKFNIRKICGLLLGVADLFHLLLVLLPLYPENTGGYVYAVTLFGYEEIDPFFKLIYLVLFGLIIAAGIAKIILTEKEAEKPAGFVTSFSVAVSTAAVLVLALTRESYAVSLAFLLLLAKGGLILECARKK